MGSGGGGGYHIYIYMYTYFLFSISEHSEEFAALLGCKRETSDCQYAQADVRHKLSRNPAHQGLGRAGKPLQTQPAAQQHVKTVSGEATSCHKTKLPTSLSSGILLGYFAWSGKPKVPWRLASAQRLKLGRCFVFRS